MQGQDGPCVSAVIGLATCEELDPGEWLNHSSPKWKYAIVPKTATQTSAASFTKHPLPSLGTLGTLGLAAL